MMSQSGSFRFLKTEDFKLIRLPYGKTESLAAYVLLPEEKFGLRKLADRITGKSWKSWLSRLSRSRGRIVLPRFELTYEKELNEPLKDLGMELAFDRTRADLTGIIDLPTQNAYISKVRHKTLLEVTERGTKAAGATSVKVGLTSLGPSEDSFKMVVDHPFLFAIRDEKSGALLFLGNIRNPRKVGKN
jgi:serpin B